jgi:hypothetical protein
MASAPSTPSPAPPKATRGSPSQPDAKPCPQTATDRTPGITNSGRPIQLRSINALRAILREVPEDFPGRNAEVNRLLPPLAASIYAVLKDLGTEIPYDSRIEHIATGGVAKYPGIVITSLDELSAEFEAIYR